VKLEKLNHRKINRFSTAAYSSEMVGSQGLDSLDVEHLQEDNGSVAYSPAATAFFARYVRPGDAAALAYLYQACQDGAASMYFPIDIFERAWGLWNLGLTRSLESRDFAKQVLQFRLPYLGLAQTTRCWHSQRLLSV
jgi:halimadienyl-diphosphate synthase